MAMAVVLGKRHIDSRFTEEPYTTRTRKVVLDHLLTQEEKCRGRQRSSDINMFTLG